MTTFNGPVESSQSGYRYFTTPSPPNAPSALETQAFSDHVDLGWTDNSTNEDGFKIERKTGSGSWSQIASVGENSDNADFYTDDTTSPSTTYSYRVYAYNSSGNSAYSGTVTLTTPGAAPGPFTLSNEAPYWDTDPPAGPAVRLNWTVSSDAGAYALYRDGSVYAAGLLGTTYLNELGLVAGVTYSYFVRASNAEGTRDSNTIQITMPDGPDPDAPPNVDSVSPHPVPSSTSVLITIGGNDFQNGCEVHFQDTSENTYTSKVAKLDYISSSELTYDFNNDNDAGTWRVRVKNPDGQLSSWFDFTVATLSGLRVDAPNGGESVHAGTSLPVAWTVGSGVPPVSFFFVKYSLNGGATWSFIDGGYVSGTTRATTWNVPEEAVSDQARIQVLAYNSSGAQIAADSSDSDFEISSGSSRPLAVPDCNNNAPAPGALVTFYGSGSRASSGNPSPTLVSYSWNFGDGGSASGATVSHAFEAVGTRTFAVSLTVTDSLGLSDTKTLNITVTGQALGPDTQQSLSDDPVNLATGNFLYDHVDLSLPGIGFPFKFQRFYNSKDTGNTDGPMGAYWSHSYNISVDASNSVARVIYGDGRRETYTNSAGVYMAEPGTYNTLTTNATGSFKVTTKDQMQYEFDAIGRLASIADKNGNTLRLSYTPTGDLTTITNSAGRVVSFVSDGNHRITQIIDPLNRTNSYEYSAQGDLVSVTDPRGGVTRYGYDSEHQMTNSVDPNGNQFVQNVYSLNRVVEAQRDALGSMTSFTYDFVTRETVVSNALGYRQVHKHDEDLRVVQIMDESGEVQNFEYDEFNNRTKVVDKNRRATSYTYDARGNVTSKTDPLGNVTTIAYDPLNNPTNRADAKSGLTTFAFDVQGNLVETVNPQSFTNTVTYDSRGRPSLVSDANGHTLSNIYDAVGNLVSVTDALGFTWTYSYDAAGRKVAETDPNSATNHYAYDGNNNLIESVNALGFTNSFAYDLNANQTLVQDARGYQTIKTYDAKDRLITVRDPLGGVVSNIYDALDRRIATTDQRGNTTSFTYDPVGNLTAVSNALGYVTRYTYDPNGNQLTTMDPLGQVTTNEYDALNRIVAVTDPLGNTTRYTYDELGRRTQVQDALLQVTQFRYDSLGRLTNVIDAAAGVVSFAYDNVGNRTAMTEPNGHTVTYTYDALSRLVQKQEPVGTYLYEYDGVGNQISRKDANGQSVTNSYDTGRRLTAIQYPDGSEVKFAYDVAGNRVRMTDATGTTTYGYDSLNRMTNCTDSAGHSVSYSYDAAGNRISMTYPGNKVVAYTFDALNRMATTQDWLGGITTNAYDAASNLVRVEQPNGTTTRYGYDDARRLTSLTNALPDTSVISAYALTLDAVGNHRSSVQIDPIEPLIATQTVSYAYDSDNRLSDVSGTGVTYDSNGNMVTRGADTFAYDFENRLTEAVIGGTTRRYAYDGVGNRLSATRAGVTTRYVLDVNDSLVHVLAEADDGGSIKAYYVYGRGLLSRISVAGTATYYHYDVRGSTVAMTDSSGNLTDKYAYGPFGTLANSAGSTDNPFKYVGRYGVMDEGNGLAYIRARYYSPELGRFVTKDPMTGKDGDSQSLNRYIYALNNPVRYVDVSGFCASPPSGVYGSSDDMNDVLLDFGERFVTNLRNALYSEALNAYAFDRLFDSLESSAGDYLTFRDSASLLMGIVRDGIEEVQARGDIADAIRNLPLNIEFARNNPDALLDALEDGFESVIAVAVNAATREFSGGYVDIGFTGGDFSGIGSGINNGINAGLNAYVEGIQRIGSGVGNVLYNMAPGVFQ